ncbi:MAG: acetyl-CoA carboxylase biotin carboxyl carrier protein [Defluviitaleaceae bacterium]|nr:acetyl-CoA carboxylase biotin carboxyl carrier protein [Defluviitaleaceae bacterium]
MNFKEIMELTQWVEKSAFTTYSLSVGAIHLNMSKQAASYPIYPPIAAPVATPITMPAPQPPIDVQIPTVSASQTEEAPKAQSSSAGHVVASPIVGTFYDRSNPESKPFVSVGQSVKKGDVLCILEAMKIMNEITADVDGVVSEILVKNGDMVEARQSLFNIEV